MSLDKIKELYIRKKECLLYAKRHSISISTVLFLSYIFSTIMNTSKHGASLSFVFIPISLFIISVFLKKEYLRFRYVHVICLMFWLTAVISTVFSSIVSVQRNILTFFAFVILFIVASAIISERKDIKAVLITYLITALLSSLNILVNYCIGHEYKWKRYSVYYMGVYKDPNYVSAFIVPAVAVLFYKLLITKSGNTFRTILYSVCCLILIVGVLATGSRAAFLTLLLATIIILFYFIIITSNKVLKFYTIGVLFLSVSFILIFVLPDFTVSRFLDFTKYADNIRIVYWINGLKVFLENPILGGGLGAASTYLINNGLSYSHNVFLDILCGQDIIGFVLLMIMFINFLRVKNKDVVFMIVVLVSFFMPLFFVNGFNTATFWTPMIICQILSDFSRQSSESVIQLIEDL